MAGEPICREAAQLAAQAMGIDPLTLPAPDFVRYRLAFWNESTLCAALMAAAHVDDVQAYLRLARFYQLAAEALRKAGRPICQAGVRDHAAKVAALQSTGLNK